MATQITTKSGFIKWLTDGLEDDDIIILTSDHVGEISVKPKLNQMKIPFSFAADSFKRKDTVGDFAFGRIPTLAFAICKQEDASQETLNMIKALNKRTKNKK